MNESKEFVLNCVKDWLDIKKMENFRYRKTEYASTAADVDHSSLLSRLLDGEKIYKNPPPKSYSYPDTGMAEGLLVGLQDMPDVDILDDARVVINQSSYRVISGKISTLGESKMIVEVPATKERYAVWIPTEDERSSVKAGVVPRYVKAVIQKIDPPEYYPDVLLHSRRQCPQTYN